MAAVEDLDKNLKKRNREQILLLAISNCEHKVPLEVNNLKYVYLADIIMRYSYL